jgi:hypothetical protein
MNSALGFPGGLVWLRPGKGTRESSALQVGGKWISEKSSALQENCDYRGLCVDTTYFTEVMKTQIVEKAERKLP